MKNLRDYINEGLLDRIKGKIINEPESITKYYPGLADKLLKKFGLNDKKLPTESEMDTLLNYIGKNVADKHIAEQILGEILDIYIFNKNLVDLDKNNYERDKLGYGMGFFYIHQLSQRPHMRDMYIFAWKKFFNYYNVNINTMPDYSKSWINLRKVFGN